MTDPGRGRESVPSVCFVLDDEPAVGRFMAMALGARGLTVEQFLDLNSMIQRLEDCHPDLIFLDVALGEADAVDAIRALAKAEFAGVVALMSGEAADVLEDVRLIGERNGLHVAAVLTKPFRLDAIKGAIDAAAEQPTLPRERVPTQSVALKMPVVELRQALDNGWVELWYQPKVDVRHRRLVGAEGLARVRHPELGVLRPESFLPGASETDMNDLAEVCLRTALDDGLGFANMGRRLALAINVPVYSLVSLPIVTIVKEHRRRTESRQRLILEVTEDEIVDDVAAAYEAATKLRIHGIELSLDDFGKGYSSLARIGELPFAEMKLDMSFVADCSRDVERAHICQMIIDLAHRFGCKAVAEGVERLTDLTAVRDMGCDVVQGYLFAHPMPKAFFASRLTAPAEDGGFATVLDMIDPPNARAIA